MSSSVTIDWRAVRERERQACLALRAELAQLQAREKRLRLRSEAVSAAYGKVRADVYHVGRAHGSADSAELGRLVGEAREGLARSEAAVDQAIGSASQKRAQQAASIPAWTSRSGSGLAPPPRAAVDIDVGQRAAAAAHGGTPPMAHQDASVLAEAETVLEECRLRCPGADLSELTGLRAGLGSSPLHDQTVLQDLRIRGAQLIQRVKRLNELEDQRQRLFVLAEDAPVAERARLRRTVADAPPEDVPRLDRVVMAAVQRASAERARAEAVSAVQRSLEELGYDVQGGFASLLPSEGLAQGAPVARAAQVEPPFLLAASPHSADHGLRVRVGEDQLYLSVVRRAGSAGHGTSSADTEVQELTCQDLLAVAATAARQGVTITLGNAQEPGRPAPELAAEHWPRTALEQADSPAVADRGADERHRRWAAQEQQRVTGQPQVRSKRPDR